MDAGSDASLDARPGLDASDPDSGSAECIAVVAHPPPECGSEAGWVFDGTACVEGCSDEASSFAAGHDCALQCAGGGHCSWEKFNNTIQGPPAAGQEFDGVEICTRSADLRAERADLQAISNRFRCPSMRAYWCMESACGIDEHFVLDDDLLAALCAASLLEYVETIELIDLL